jgi:hypothetical protein
MTANKSLVLSAPSNLSLAILSLLGSANFKEQNNSIEFA